ncbi:MAG: sialidase [Elusimicrobia bacterium]|nr:sialidase [Elusimicrobiota bacterium]
MILASLLLGAVLSSAEAPVKFDAGTISGLPARNIGSAQMSGRVSAVAAIKEGGRLTVFAGAASGGVWKSVNGGSIFKPVFDNQPVQSIGALAIDPTNPKTIWAGTGESWLRNSVSVGDGIYKSVDGGENWDNAGLKDSEHIAKIIVDPKDGNTVWACATGHLWDDSAERGVYKTVEGGKTWKKVLGGANGSTGCAMLAMSPKEPKTLYAALWDFRRQAWTFRSGGPGSGLFKSTDGGDTWTELAQANAKGLPEKPYGRIALAVAPGKPSTVYAMIESKASALFRSDDGGLNWRKLDASQYMVWRPFYFGNLIVDPADENKVFKVDMLLLMSVDGGRSFSAVSGNAHGDFHDVWIDAENSNTILAGDDGGLWRSLDGGMRWEHFLNLPISQFYHVSADGEDPYRVYGGLQDNSSWVGDSSFPGGVSNSRWENIYGGDGFWTWVDPSDSNYLYAEYQGGAIGRVNRRTHETRAVTPYPLYGEKKLRFNWNTPIALSPNEKGTIYIGAQFLYRSRDHGQSWERISPDLSTKDPEKQKQEESGGVTIDNSAAEMNTSLYAISESPKKPGLIWAGTDDGKVWRTDDAGKRWIDLTANIKGVGSAPWVTSLKAGRFKEGAAYATVDRHRYGDMKPYLFKTSDFGKTWSPLGVQESGVRGWAHVITEDPVDPDLLYLGTEFGLWISVDAGRHWAQYQGGHFPAVAVHDIVVHPRESDLILATHGRGIWIIDDVSPWRSLTPQLLSRDAAFLPIPPAVQRMETSGGWSEGENSFNGPNRGDGADIPYYQKGRHIFGDLKLEILDGKGVPVDTVASAKHRGVNRASWSMHLKPPRVPPAASAAGSATIGPRVLPGVYTVRMTKGDKVYTARLKVVMDPRAKYTVEDRKAQFALVEKLASMLNHMSWAVDAVVALRDQAKVLSAKLGPGDELEKPLAGLAADLDAIRAKIVATKEGGMITGEERLREFLANLYGDVNGYDGRPTASQTARAAALGRELDDVVREFASLSGKTLGLLNEKLAARKLGALKALSESDWKAAQSD